MKDSRFVALDVYKLRMSVSVAEGGRSGDVEYLGEIGKDPSAINDIEENWKYVGIFLLRGRNVRLRHSAAAWAWGIDAMW